MGHVGSDAVLDLLEVTSEGVRYRMGVVMRPTTAALPASAAAREFALQIAAPPPDRTDGSAWYDGLRVDDGTEDGRPFDPDEPSWTDSAVFAVQGISPLGVPDAATVVFDEPHFSVPRVTDVAGARFTLVPSDERVPDGVNSFLSLTYPLPRNAKTGNAMRKVATTFYREGRFDFDRPVSGFVALSLEAFTPPDRSSVEFLFFVP